MPITIDHPSGAVTPTNVETVLEVGSYIEFHTDFIGPLNPDAFWTVEVWLNADAEHFAMRRRYPFTSSRFRGFQWQPGLRDPAEDGEGLGFRITNTVANNATLRVQLDDPTTGFHEQTQVTRQLTLPFDIHSRIAQNTTGATGFSEQDRSDLEVVKASVQVPFPLNNVVGAVANTALSQLVQSMPLQLLTRQECRVITGDGSLTRPSAISQVNAFGFTWDFTGVPTYFGRGLGTLLEFEQRIVQFQVIQRDFGGQEHTTQVIDAHSDNQYVTWGLNTPHRIEYSVTPGCQVQFCWLLLLGTPSP